MFQTTNQKNGGWTNLWTVAEKTRLLNFWNLSWNWDSLGRLIGMKFFAEDHRQESNSPGIACCKGVESSGVIWAMSILNHFETIWSFELLILDHFVTFFFSALKCYNRAFSHHCRCCRSESHPKSLGVQASPPGGNFWWDHCRTEIEKTWPQDATGVFKTCCLFLEILNSKQWFVLRRCWNVVKQSSNLL